MLPQNAALGKTFDRPFATRDNAALHAELVDLRRALANRPEHVPPVRGRTLIETGFLGRPARIIVGGAAIRTPDARVTLHADRIDVVLARRWFIWRVDLVASTWSLAIRTFYGRRASALVRAIVEERIALLGRELAARDATSRAGVMRDAWMSMLEDDRYIRRAELRAWWEGQQTGRDALELAIAKASERDARTSAARHVATRLADKGWLERCVRSHNYAWSAREAARLPSIFGPRPELDQGPLTERQARIATSEERTVLGLAAAGTGKTSVVLRKVEYHITRGTLAPANSLLLSFSNAAVDELKNRFAKVPALAGCWISTLHKFAMDAMASILDDRRRISDLSKKDDALAKWVGEQLTEALDDPDLNATLRDFLVAGMYPYRTHHEFASLGEYFEYLQNSRLLGLDDAWYKSFGEVYCANFSLMNGLAYNYEQPYPHVQPSVDRGRYYPDFQYPDVPEGSAPGWFEFFGVDEFGRVRADIDQRRYLDDMRQKIALHDRFRTPLVYATYGQFRINGAVPTLRRAFTDGWRVRLAPIGDEAVAQLLSSHGVRDKLAKLLGNVLRGSRARDLDVAELEQRATAFGERGRLFMQIYRCMLERFERHHLMRYEADFDGLLRDLGDALEAGIEVPLLRRCHFDFVFVDEYQDVTAVQQRFVHALVQRYGARTVMVGDDCQAIYTWAGADQEAVQRVSTIFGDTDVLTFDRSFRCIGPVLRTALRFVERNPHQIAKAVLPNAEPDDPRDPRVLVVGGNGDLQPTVERAIAEGILRFRRSHPGREPEVLVLACKSDNLPEEKCRQDELRVVHGCPIDFRTIHRAKGLGADVVVVCDLVGGTYGFPDRRPQDPLVCALLGLAERHPDEDDRRLFYVALTRAKQYVLLCTDWTKPSDFVTEVLEYPEVFGLDDAPARPPAYHCTSCETGVLRRRVESNRWACEHKRMCGRKYHVCDREGCDGPLLPEGNPLRCARCGFEPPRCSRCGSGAQLRRRDGKFGCSRYTTRPEIADACKYRASAPEVGRILAARHAIV